MATTMTQPGMRVKKTTYTEVIPPEDRSPSDAQPSAFYADEWENVVQKLSPDQWQGHIMRVYRADEKWDRSSSPVDNTFVKAFTEEDLRARFGGGRFLLWLYGPPKRQTLLAKYRATLDGDPIVTSVPRNGNGAAAGADTVAIEAMRMASNPEFVRLQMDMMRTAMTTAIEMVKNQIPQQQDPLQTLRNAKEILGIGSAPSPDGTLIAHITLLKELGLIGSPEKKGITEVLETLTAFKTAGLVPSAAPKADLATTFATNLPMFVNCIVSGLREFRLTAEAEERKHGHGRVIDMPPQTPAETSAPAAAANAATAAAPASSNGATRVTEVTQVTPEVAQAIIAQAHLHRLVTGIKNPKSTGQDMYDYLVNAWPEVLDELAKMNAPTLLAFFKSRDTQMQYFQTDILTEVANDPRLPKIIEDFLRIAKDEAAIAAAETVAASTAAVV